MSKLFGGKTPFDDPFFTQPFTSFLGANPFDYPFFNRPIYDRAQRQVTIEELNPDDDLGFKTTDSGKEIIPEIENPIWNTHGMKRSFMYQKVAYGGPEGIYYTFSEGMATGGDGVFVAEIKEEDKSIDESLHTISKGLRNKGHSMTTKKRSNGEKKSMQTLHNLNEDELSGFEEDWKNKAEKYFSGWDGGFDLLEDTGANQIHNEWDGFPQLGWDGFESWNGWTLPSSSAADYGGTSAPPPPPPPNENRPKKIVPVNID